MWDTVVGGGVQCMWKKGLGLGLGLGEVEEKWREKEKSEENTTRQNVFFSFDSKKPSQKKTD